MQDQLQEKDREIAENFDIIKTLKKDKSNKTKTGYKQETDNE